MTTHKSERKESKAVKVSDECETLAHLSFNLLLLALIHNTSSSILTRKQCEEGDQGPSKEGYHGRERETSWV